ncbi:MAG: radical SAM protein [Candidatus Thiodiazotropha lotti]|nr:radical SAM protein [Candidatus Thiodiazotropha lotti]
MSNNKPRLYHINITRRCNLGCTHCYIEPEIRDRDLILSPGQFSEIMATARDLYREDQRPPEIHIIGGEPTLVPIEHHRAYLDAVSKQLDGIPHTLTLVSALPNRRAVKIGELYSEVIVSWDADARKQNQWLWLGHINTLRRAGVDLRVAVTLSKTVLAYGIDRVLDYLLYDAGFEEIHLAPLIPTPNAQVEMPLNGEISKALIVSAKWGVAHPHVEIMPYTGLLQFNASGIVYDGLVCPVQQDAINIEPDLRICSCVGKGGVSDDLIGYNGNLTAMIRSAAMQQEKIMHSRLPAYCLKCQHQELCLGGCRIALEHQPFDESGECHGFSRFLDYMADLEASLELRAEQIVVR